MVFHHRWTLASDDQVFLCWPPHVVTEPHSTGHQRKNRTNADFQWLPLILAVVVRRFAVVPLTEETGIIEWVPNTHGLRHCCQDIYIADGTYDKRSVNMTVKKIHDSFTVCHLP